MTIFCQEVNGQLSTITKILNKKNKSEAKESILNSKFAKKPQVVEIKKPKLKLTRLGTFDYSRCVKVSEDVILRALSSF